MNIALPSSSVLESEAHECQHLYNTINKQNHLNTHNFKQFTPIHHSVCKFHKINISSWTKHVTITIKELCQFTDHGNQGN